MTNAFLIATLNKLEAPAHGEPGFQCRYLSTLNYRLSTD
jgi:hypothetical protein